MSTSTARKRRTKRGEESRGTHNETHRRLRELRLSVLSAANFLQELFVLSTLRAEHQLRWLVVLPLLRQPIEVNHRACRVVRDLLPAAAPRLIPRRRRVLRAAPFAMRNREAVHAKIVVALVAHEYRALALALRAEHVSCFQDVALAGVDLQEVVRLHHASAVQPFEARRAEGVVVAPLAAPLRDLGPALDALRRPCREAGVRRRGVVRVQVREALFAVKVRKGVVPGARIDLAPHFVARVVRLAVVAGHRLLLRELELRVGVELFLRQRVLARPA